MSPLLTLLLTLPLTLPLSLSLGKHQAITSTNISRIISSNKQVYIITTDGTLLSAGSNDNNELGRQGKRSLLHRVDALEACTVTDICVGVGFVMCILSDGRQISWGKNDLGQLGLGIGNREDRAKPRSSSIINSIQSGGGFVQCAAGNTHCVGITKNGNIYTWGGNRQGQLGNISLSLSLSLFKYLHVHIYLY